LNRSARCLKLSESFLVVHAAFDRSIVLFQNIVQVLHRSVPATPPNRSFVLYLPGWLSRRLAPVGAERAVQNALALDIRITLQCFSNPASRRGLGILENSSQRRRL
jgi:hypothetical protein